MGKPYDGITPELSDWIEQQDLFSETLSCR
jgi:hypothetical protein